MDILTDFVPLWLTDISHIGVLFCVLNTQFEGVEPSPFSKLGFAIILVSAGVVVVVVDAGANAGVAVEVVPDDISILSTYHPS